MKITHDPTNVAVDCDVVYTDSWMSYGIPKDQEEERVKILTPYQVNENVMAQSKPDSVFMNCLPAVRGQEQTTGVVDGPHSIVFDVAENRLYAQKAIVLFLLNKI